MDAPSRDYIPLAKNERARMLLARLRQGPASTLDLQSELPLVHVARQVWELRHWYGFQIKTGRTASRVAIYELAGDPIQDDRYHQDELFPAA